MISIKKFEMPENCIECPCSSWIYDFCTCKLTGKEFPEPKKRYRYCPLQESGCDICEYKHRCSKRPAGKAVIFGCKDFKKEDEVND